MLYYVMDAIPGYGARIWLRKCDQHEEAVLFLLGHHSTWGGCDKQDKHLMSFEYTEALIPMFTDVLDEAGYTRTEVWLDFVKDIGVKE